MIYVASIILAVLFFVNRKHTKKLERELQLWNGLFSGGNDKSVGSEILFD
jgi:hypothetical protein